MRLEKRQCVPEDVSVGRFQFILEESANWIIDGIPEAQQQICSFPDLWYVVKNFQAPKFVVKLSNEKEKRLSRGLGR